jgi:cellulose synthase/poly-beta-1,6-N-acetylglucosamine synthase-like glycosyltransferase
MNAVISIMTVVCGAQLTSAILLAYNTYRRNHRNRSSVQHNALAISVLCFTVGWLIGVANGGDILHCFAAAVVGAVVSGAAGRRLANFWPAGTTYVATKLALCGLSVVWSMMFLAFIVDHGGSLPTIVLTAISLLISVAFLPSDLLWELATWQVLFRARWRRRGGTVRTRPPGYAPMVSIQVPIHAEPPEIVIRTLDALSALNYPDYEVIVIDNNTADQALWRPVEEHCARLGPRFRFLHVEGIHGAKAGALNWARPYIARHTELVGIIDADYVAHPDWLAHTVGYFQDPAMGFVQCPHAYRDYESSAFGRIANAEYTPFFRTAMIGLDENEAGITVGTMSVIRLAALDRAGGWAEWCMTEDSELAIRIHAAGYTSTYVERPYGWGLIPQTWAGYKKQRFRWTYGPVQEFLTHFRLFRPGKKRTPSRLDVVQRAYHCNHGLKVCVAGLRFAVLVFGPAILLSMIAQGDIWPVPPNWLVPFVATFIAKQFLRWAECRQIGYTAREFLGLMIASRALLLVTGSAALAALLGRNAVWQRTDKFRRRRPAFAPLQGAVTESVLAVLFLTFAVLSISALPFGIVSATMACGFLSQSLTFAAAPLLSYLSARDVQRSQPVLALSSQEEGAQRSTQR